jgi:hypothetical protein
MAPACDTAQDVGFALGQPGAVDVLPAGEEASYVPTRPERRLG